MDMLSNRGCSDSAGVQDLSVRLITCPSSTHESQYVDDGNGNEYYHFVPVPGLTDTFNIITCVFQVPLCPFA